MALSIKSGAILYLYLESIKFADIYGEGQATALQGFSVGFVGRGKRSRDTPKHWLYYMQLEECFHDERDI